MQDIGVRNSGDFIPEFAQYEWPKTMGLFAAVTRRNGVASGK